MELLLIVLVPLVTAGSILVTLSWAVPAAGEHYFGRKVTR